MMLAQLNDGSTDPNAGGEIEMAPVQAGQILAHIEGAMPWYWHLYNLVVPGNFDESTAMGSFGAKLTYFNWQQTCSAAQGANAAAQCTVAREQKDAIQTKALTRLGLIFAALGAITYGVYYYRKVSRHG